MDSPSQPSPSAAMLETTAADGVKDSSNGTQTGRDESSSHQPVKVEVRVANITRQDLHVLESALNEWVLWHRNQYEQGYPEDAQLLTGSIGLDVDQLIKMGVISWTDTLAPVSGTGNNSNNRDSYEQVEAPPMYDRAVHELLAPAAVAPGGRISMLPGGAEAARRRAAAEACYGTDGSDSPVPAQAVTKRRKLSENRCFNCGSYAHGIADCSKPLDQERVAAARTEQAANRRPTNGFMAKLGKQRYFNTNSGDANGADIMRPGCISAELAEALGMSSNLAPPPWLGRMAILGVPPRYCAADKTAAEPERIRFIFGDSEDADDEVAADVEADSSTQGDASAAMQGQEDPADADFVPLGGQAVQLQEKSTSQPEGDDSLTSKQQTYTQQFPGINAALPEGADAAAWQAELEKSAYIGRMMGLVV